MKKILILVSLFVPSLLWALTGRSDLDRYTLLRDRTIIDRQIKKGVDRPEYSYFFNIDLVVSSGTRKLINDVENGVDEKDGDTLAQIIAIQGVLNKHLNTEKYADFELGIGIPLPSINTRSFEMNWSLFFSQNFGIMNSIDNSQDASNPRAQLYLKTDTKFGTNIQFIQKKDEQWSITPYLLLRSDLLISRSVAQIVDKTELLDFDELTDSKKDYLLDLRWDKRNGKSFYTVEGQELSLKYFATKESNYGNKPLIHARYRRLFEPTDWKINAFAGAHYRARYTIFDGLYIGATLRYKEEIPLIFSFKMSNEFLHFMPTFRSKYAHISYTIKTPYINPQDEIWVSAHHSINIMIPFI